MNLTNIEFAGLSVTISDIDVAIPAWAIIALGGLIAILILFYHFRYHRRATSAIKYSDVRLVKRAARSGRQRFLVILPILRALAVLALFVALARPRAGTEYQEVRSEGVDIILALDVSSSMQAEDFKPHNRLYVAKEEIKKFIENRVNDRIGLVVFARYSFTQCPLTTDYRVLLRFVDEVNFGMVEDGTAIGMALANSVNRLRESEAKSKVIILLTDGENNAGEIDPVTAANLAHTMGVKIYTIGAGGTGNAMYPYQDPIFGKRYVYQPTKIDETTLKEIAERTQGKYFRARSGKELEEIYGIIDEMEKTEIEVAEHVRYTELFYYLLHLGFGLMALELLLGQSVLRKLP